MKRIAIIFGMIAVAFTGWMTYQILTNSSSAESALNSSGISTTTTTTSEVAEDTTDDTEQESTDLQDILDDFDAEYPGQTAAVVIDTETGASAEVNGDTQMVSASLYKLYVAYSIYKQIDAGELDYSDSVGSSTVEECLDLMITISDNTCGYNLGEQAGWATIDAQLANLGLTGTTTDNYDSYGNIISDKQTTASDVALFIQKLYNNELLSDDSTKAFIDLLKAQEHNDFLASGLPTGTVFAHKTGDLYDVVHDAGIVYTDDGAYIIVVMTEGWDTPLEEGPVAHKEISSKIWDYFDAL